MLFEGAQGALLDVDHGTYPFVTRRRRVAGGRLHGGGHRPDGDHRVIGITKAYTTRVGGGPFPTELTDALGERLRKAGGEFGATTGRPRRCGWLDVAALRLAVRWNGLAGLALTKLDVLRGMGEVKICVAYNVDGEASTSCRPTRARSLARSRSTRSSRAGTPTRARCATSASCRRRRRSTCAASRRWSASTAALISVGPGRAETIVIRNPFR